MAEPEWTVLAEAGRVRVLEATGVPGEPPRLLHVLLDPQTIPKPGEASGEPMQRFARQVAELLEQEYAHARFEFLRIAIEPRFDGPLRSEIDRRLDLHRAVLEWRALEVIPPDAALPSQPPAGFAQGPGLVVIDASGIIAGLGHRRGCSRLGSVLGNRRWSGGGHPRGGRLGGSRVPIPLDIGLGGIDAAVGLRVNAARGNRLLNGGQGHTAMPGVGAQAHAHGNLQAVDGSPGDHRPPDHLFFESDARQAPRCARPPRFKSPGRTQNGFCRAVWRDNGSRVGPPPYRRAFACKNARGKRFW